MSSSLQAVRESLPRLPLSSLERSCSGLLQWAAPLLTEEEYAASGDAVKKFLTGEGPSLQSRLDLLRRERGDAILRLAPYWEEWYLASRQPLPVHVNPFYLFAEDALPPEDIPWGRAASLALAAVSFCLAIDRGEMEPDYFKGSLLNLQGYSSLFRTTRRAFFDRDERHTGRSTTLSGRSLLVLSKGRLFLLEVVSPEGEIRDREDTARALEAIAGGEEGPSLPLGLMTCLPREEAARGRKLLCTGGKENLSALARGEESLFVLRLDPPCGGSLEEKARHFLFDGGGNGWYEKSFQLIVTADGAAGLNFEHSARDGIPVGRLVREILERSPAAGGSALHLSPPDPLSFTLSPEMTAFLEEGKEAALRLASSVEQRILEFTPFGTGGVKGGGMSPDAFVQIALLLTWRKVKGEWGSVFESVHLRRFRGGRTEGVRPLTAEAALFGDAFREGSASREELRALLKRAGQAHRRRVEACLAGEGIEGHLTLLRTLAQQNGQEEPALFLSPAWTKLTACAISSSTTAAHGMDLAGYGPVEGGGLGVRYLSREEYLRFHIASWRADDPLGSDFFSALPDVLGQMGTLL